MLYSSKGVVLAQGGYAWVIASHLDRQAAMSDMVRYRVAGYRSGTYEDGGGGSVAYRVLIGHFPTKDIALQARSQLPEDVPGGIWLLEIARIPQ